MAALMWLATIKKPNSAPSDHSTLAGFSRVALYLGAMLLEPGVGQFCGEAAHRCQHEMGALSMPTLRHDLRQALHDEDPMRIGSGLIERGQPAVELVAEYPHRLHSVDVRWRSGRAPIARGRRLRAVRWPSLPLPGE